MDGKRGELLVSTKVQLGDKCNQTAENADHDFWSLTMSTPHCLGARREWQKRSSKTQTKKPAQQTTNGAQKYKATLLAIVLEANDNTPK
ncbi:unnamed protein product [Toxocara canis]|uniref:Uncharacterized protein n=1 Tax=Toxocara canis TaxID=6265 RepID=A0A183U3M3_TOXCA|nr:unnamed protein product [Toxocara canis]